MPKIYSSSCTLSSLAATLKFMGTFFAKDVE